MAKIKRTRDPGADQPQRHAFTIARQRRVAQHFDHQRCLDLPPWPPASPVANVDSTLPARPHIQWLAGKQRFAQLLPHWQFTGRLIAYHEYP